MRLTKEYFAGCVMLCERRRDYLRRLLAKAKERGDIREQARIRAEILRNLERKFMYEDMIAGTAKKHKTIVAAEEEEKNEEQVGRIHLVFA